MFSLKFSRMVLLLISFFTSFLIASDMCVNSKSHSFSSGLTDIYTDSYSGNQFDNGDYENYYFELSTPGTITFIDNSPSNKLKFTYSKNNCPSINEAAMFNGQKIVFESAEDFNLKISSSGNNQKYNFTIKYEPTLSHADAVCYNNLQNSGTCTSNGTCQGGIGCTSTFPLTNISNNDLKNFTVYYEEDGISRTMSQNCTLSSSGSCNIVSNIDMGVLGILNQATSFSFDNDFLAEQNNSISSTASTDDNTCPNPDNLYAEYQIDTIFYKGKIQPCPETIINFEQEIYNISEDYNAPIGSTSLLEVKVTLSEAVTYDIEVNYNMLEGEALAGLDYVDNQGVITIPAGAKEKIIYIGIYHDMHIELDESFFLTLANPKPLDGQPNNGRVRIGTDRTKIVILEQGAENLPICYEDNFGTTLDDKWRTLYSNGSFNPSIVNGRLRLTPGVKNIATAVTKDYEFPSKYNMIVVEFEQFAYGGCGSSHDGVGIDGADGIVAVLYDSAVGASPVPGAYGGSMGYAQGHGKNGFEGGWLGLGIDEYGNYANCNEGRVGGLTGTSCDSGNAFNAQNYRNYASIRGDGTGSTGYDFLAASTQLNPKVAVKDTSNASPGHKYRMTADARDPNHLFITLERDAGSGYQVIINKFDAKDPQYNQTTTPELVRFALTAGTGGGCNNHEIDELRVSGICQVYNPTAPEITTAKADIVNNFAPILYNSGIKNITTKIVSKLQSITGVYLNSIGQTVPYQSSAPDSLFFKIMPYISNEDCSERELLLDSNGNPAIINVSNGNYSADLDVLMPSNARKNVRFGISALDMSELYDASQETCLLNSSTTGNLQGIGQCINSETKYKKIFGEAAWQRCYNNNGAPCKSENHGRGDGEYNHAYGCLMCTLDSNTSCSSDNFAIRPYAFKAFGLNQYKKAGEDFNITVKALNEATYALNSGHSNTISGVNDYNASIGDLDFTSVLFNETDPTISTNCPSAGTFSVLNPFDSFSNGEAIVQLKFSETGILDINISERVGAEFAAIDNKAYDTVNAERYIMPSSTTYQIDNIANSILMAFIPYQFDTNATVVSTGGVNWVYDHNASLPDPQTGNVNVATLKDMSVAVKYHIQAKNKDGAITSNFTNTCFFNTGAPFINGLKKNTTFDLFLDITLVGSNTANESLNFYVEEDGAGAVWMPAIDTLINNIPKLYQLLVFPANFTNGESRTSVYLNVERSPNQAINPLFITFVDANTSTSWMANPGATNIFNGDALDVNRTFYSGRSFTPRQRYHTNIGTAPVYYEIYCNQATGCDTTLLPVGVNSFIEDSLWLTNTAHTAALGGQNRIINQKAGGNRVTATNSLGALPDTTAITYDGSRSFPYTTTMQHLPQSWLIYNKYDAGAASNDFEVEYLGGQDGSWAGKHETNTTTTTTSSPVTNRRVMW